MITIIKAAAFAAAGLVLIGAWVEAMDLWPYVIGPVTVWALLTFVIWATMTH